MISKSPSTRRSAGFALLLTLIVVSVALAIGLSILDVTLKQYTLSVTGRESEIAFHIANSMIECFQLARDDDSATYEAGNPPPDIQCLPLGQKIKSVTPSSGSGQPVYHYEYQFETTEMGGACGQISAYILDATAGPITNYPFSGEGLDDTDCEEGLICTVAFGRGYNRQCDQLGSLRTVQRELTISF